MAEPGYKVVWPLGKSACATVEQESRVSDLRGKTICELWNGMFKGDEVFFIVRESLQKRYPGIKFGEYSLFGNIHSPKEGEVLAALPELLRKHGCDAVISGIGG